MKQMKQMKELRLLLMWLLSGAALAAGTSNWQLPTPEGAQRILSSCKELAVGLEAEQLRCLAQQLGLWTDERGYNARRIAKIFAARQQMEEIQLVVNYCNSRERRPEQPAQWAYAAYKCATSGTLGQWISEYKEQMQLIE